MGSASPLRLGVVVFPGINTDGDTHHGLETFPGVTAEYLWHKDTDLKGVDGIVIDEMVAALGYHDRVKDDVVRPVALQRLCHHIYNVRGGKHADLHRISADIVKDCLQLVFNDRKIDLLHGSHFARVLCRHGSNDRHPEHTQSGEGLQIRLNAGAAP